MISILLIAGALFSFVSLRYFLLPYIWISVCWVIVLGVLAVANRRIVWKSIWLNLAFTLFVLGVLEGHSYLSLESAGDNFRYEGRYTQGYFTSNKLFGYGPTKSRSVTAKKYWRDQLLYDVTYTIDDRGLRVSSPRPRVSGEQCVLFFGDSFTFGEGVEDHESMPYVVGELTKYQVHNFGFHGYGPHQMLAAIQYGVVTDAIDCQPGFAFYLAITDHVARSAGRASWDKHGPRYVLGSDGAVSHVGRFDDAWHSRLRAELGKSYTYRKYFLESSNYTQEDVDLFTGIVGHAQDLLKKLYPEMQFHVVFWDHSQEKSIEMIIQSLRKLKSRGIGLHLASQILPDFSGNESQYVFMYDNHPTAITHQYVARYVAKTIAAQR